MAQRCVTACRTVFLLLKQHIASLLWLYFVFSIFWSSYCKYKGEPKYFYLRQMIGSGLCMSRGMASVLNVSCFMVIVPMCRFLSSGIQILGTKMSSRFMCGWGEFSKSFHITCAYTIVFASAFHSFAHIMNAWNFSRFYNVKFGEANVARSKGEDPLLLVIVTVPGSTGVLMMVILCIMSSSSSRYLRFANYDLFWFSHHLFVIFLLLLLCHPMSGLLKEQSNVASHAPGCQLSNHSSLVLTVPSKNCTVEPVFVPQTTHTWKWVTSALLLYAVDIGYRMFQGVSSVQILSVQVFSCNVLCLKLRKQGFTARPGQFIFLHCPNVSAVEWHPFSISKCPATNDPSFTIHIRTKGDWSCSLRNRVCMKVGMWNTLSNAISPLCSNSLSLSTRLSIDGPYGSSMENVLSHPVSICIAGGIGITPFASVMNFLRADQDSSFKLKRLHILWICREAEAFVCFSTVMYELFQKMWNANRPDLLDIQLYLTKAHDLSQLKGVLGEAFSFVESRINYGRPDWSLLFQQWIANYKRCKPGVFCCGPKSLNDEIARIMNTVTRKYKIAYYQEFFS